MNSTASGTRLDRLSRSLTSRKGAWWWLAGAIIVILGVFGVFGQADMTTGNDQAPLGSESEQVEELLEKFSDSDEQSVLLIASRTDGADITDTDLADFQQAANDVDSNFVEDPSDPLPSDDNAIAMITAPITVGDASSETADTIKALRADVSEHMPADLDIQVTGGPAFAADIASSFDGADFTLLAVTIAIVAVLLIATYRSPVLWLIPLAVVGVADRLAANLTAAIAEATGQQFDPGIVSVLVFGAGTNYALLLISRYREELSRNDNHRSAMAAAWRKSFGAIAASNVTVVLALLGLLLAVIPRTHGLGISASVGLLVAALTALFLLPVVLVLFGRKVFWPFIPSPQKPAKHGAVWSKIAHTVMLRPAVSMVSGLIVLAVLATGLFSVKIGLDQTEQFRVKSESAEGFEVLAEHFPAGEAQPIDIIADKQATGDVIEAAENVDGVTRANPVATSTDDTLSHIMVVADPEPDTQASFDVVTDLRDTMHDLDGADAVVGGATAVDMDARDGNKHDSAVVAPIVLGVAFIVLIILLRSLLAPVLLLLINIASAAAAIGAGAWVSGLVFEQSALDVQVPVLAFMFLVALGIDYTIFLTHRARPEALEHGTKEGMARALAHTGSVITSAGIVLAAVFAALGVLPLVVLGQLGMIVCIGVLIDTVVVRSVIVPALFGLIGDKIWWPGKLPVGSA